MLNTLVECPRLTLWSIRFLTQRTQRIVAALAESFETRRHRDTEEIQVMTDE